MTKTFGFSQSDWDAATREAHSEMVKAAQSATGNITYSDLAAKIKAIQFEPDSQIFHELLGQISKAEDAEGRGMRKPRSQDDLMIHDEMAELPLEKSWRSDARAGSKNS
jgi:hypothetical protein